VPTRDRAALGLTTLAWCLLAVGGLVASIGPMSLPNVGISVSNPYRMVMAGALCALVAVAVRRSVPLLLRDLCATHTFFSATAVLTIALVAGLLLTRGATAVGGADSAGYLAQARRWTAGTLRVPLAIPDLPVSQPGPVQSGLGFRPDGSGRMTVPSYPPGLPLVQAAALAMGGDSAAVRGVPLAAAVVALLGLVVVAARGAGPAAAAVAVVTLASTPVFLFQALQPMSDVPALAAWLLALALAGGRSGVHLAASASCVALAILIRPNLAPLIVAVLAECHATSPARGPGATSRWRLAVIACAGGAAVGLVGALQWWLYGSPLQSGYGRASELFALGHVPANLTRYRQWLFQSVAWPALVMLAAGAMTLLVRLRVNRRPLPLVILLTVSIGLYLVYQPFDSWTYLRFVLPALAALAVGAGWALAAVMARLPPAVRVLAFVVVVTTIAIPNLQRARDLDVFAVREREARYELAGTFVREALPAAVVVAGQHSTSAAYYSGRPVIRVDLLDAPAFARVVTWARGAGQSLAFVLDEQESADLRRLLPGLDDAALDWPPRAEIGRPVATRVWLNGDRDRHRNGRRVSTTRLFARR